MIVLFLKNILDIYDSRDTKIQMKFFITTFFLFITLSNFVTGQTMYQNYYTEGAVRYDFELTGKHQMEELVHEQTKFLSGEYSFKTMCDYLKTALIYWMISIVGLVCAYYFLSESLFNSVIFIVLFAVTAPHVWVMSRMKK